MISDSLLQIRNRRASRFAGEGLSPQEVACGLAWSRREFLRSAAGVALGSTLLPSSLLGGTGIPSKKRKVVVITFGGGARDQETFAPEGQENIPHLMHELIPQSTFFTQVVNHGILGHYVATASLATGVYETFNNFAAVPPEHPTVFEYFRKDLKRPVLRCVGRGAQQRLQSHRRKQPPFLRSGTGRARDSAEASADRGDARAARDYEHLLRDNYETPLYTPQLGGNEFELQQLENRS